MKCNSTGIKKYYNNTVIWTKLHMILPSTYPPVAITLTSTITLMNCSTAVFNDTACDVITVNSSHPSVTRISYSLLDYVTFIMPSDNQPCTVHWPVL